MPLTYAGVVFYMKVYEDWHEKTKMFHSDVYLRKTTEWKKQKIIDRFANKFNIFQICFVAKFQD